MVVDFVFAQDMLFYVFIMLLTIVASLQISHHFLLNERSPWEPYDPSAGALASFLCTGVRRLAVNFFGGEIRVIFSDWWFSPICYRPSFLGWFKKVFGSVLHEANLSPIVRGLKSTAMEILETEFMSFGFVGTLGHDESAPFSSIMTKFGGQLGDSRNGTKVFSLEIWSPEGFGLTNLGNDHLFILPDDMKFQTFLLWGSSDELPPQTCKVWFLNLSLWWWQHSLGISFRWQIQVVHCSRCHLWSRIENGWTFCSKFCRMERALKVIEGNSELATRTVAMESNLATAKSNAFSHQAHLVQNVDLLPKEFIQVIPNDWILCTEVEDPKIIQPLCSFQPHVAAISSPCQPWAGSGTQKGLYRYDGILLPKGLLVPKTLRPWSFCWNRFLAFPAHDYHRHILQSLVWLQSGLVSKCQHDQSRTSRIRWLALLVRVHSHLQPLPCSIWSRLDVQSHPIPVVEFRDELRSDLYLCEEAIRLSPDPLPKKGFEKASPVQVLASRTWKNKGPIPTFMAMYGSQHCLDMDLLQTKGLQSRFLADESAPAQIRFWRPVEIAIIHGCQQILHLPNDVHVAWIG